MKKLLVSAFAVALFAGFSANQVSAGDKEKKGEKKRDSEKLFKKVDADGDGKVTLEEYKARAKGDAEKEAKAEKQFKKLDKDGDGSLTLEEFKARGGRKKKKDAEK